MGLNIYNISAIAGAKRTSPTPIPSDWYNGNWKSRIKITVDKSKISGSSDLSNFPVYIDLADLSTAFFSNVKSDGGDIRITKADGKTELPREVVSIDTTNKIGEVHFKADVLKYNEDTDFYIYFKNSSASNYDDDDTYGAQNVWDSNFKGVWHKNDITTSTIKDSTANGNNGTKKGANEPAETTGKIGKAQYYDGNDDTINCGDSSSLDLQSFTISLWIKWIYVAGNRLMVIRNSSSSSSYGFGLWERSGILFLGLNLSGQGWGDRCFSNNEVPEGEWTLATVTWSGSVSKIYINGSLDNTNTYSSGTIVNAGYLDFSHSRQWGGHYYKGDMDEIRISNVVRNGDWIATEYNNQSAPDSFYNLGTIESI